MFLGNKELGSKVHVFLDVRDAPTPSEVIIVRDGNVVKTSSNGILVVANLNKIDNLHHICIDTSNSTGDTGFWQDGSDYLVHVHPWGNVARFNLGNQKVNLVAVEGEEVGKALCEALFGVNKKLLLSEVHSFVSKNSKPLSTLTSEDVDLLISEVVSKYGLHRVHSLIKNVLNYEGNAFTKEALAAGPKTEGFSTLTADQVWNYGNRALTTNSNLHDLTKEEASSSVWSHSKVSDLETKLNSVVGQLKEVSNSVGKLGLLIEDVKLKLQEEKE